jgi:hypothetical protein
LLPDLLRKLTYLPLAIVQAAAYINVTGESLKNYGALFPETARKTLETEAMFEDPNGLKFFGTPAWKTRVQTMQTVAMEHGDIETAKAQAVTSEVPAASEKTTVTHA